MMPAALLMNAPTCGSPNALTPSPTIPTMSFTPEN
nr:MAG TPA: hypothetical protein [Caudoviricetes sp.]